MHAPAGSKVSALIATLTIRFTTAEYTQSNCRYLPGDAQWPTDKDWRELNTTTNGKLIVGTPLAQACYTPTVDFDRDSCTKVRDAWTLGEAYYEDAVNIMSPYWLNDTCSPFSGTSCKQGNIASYAVEIDGAKTVTAALKFAREKNIRVSIKNTGHDYIGRSNGRGSLALWTHKLKDISVLQYNSSYYTGPALKAGAGVQFFEAYKAAAASDLRVLGGYCPTVGMVGGYVQGGGHGPLAASYGLAADNTLEFEVVTADGQHLTASRTQNPDLYWALSGGGAGTYAVVLSLTTKAHPDGRTSGASLVIANTDPDSYWAAISSFHKRMVDMNNIPGFATSWGFDKSAFSLNVATLTGGTQKDMQNALQPFLQDLQKLNISTISYATTEHPTFYEHFEQYTFPPEIYQTNSTLGGRLIPVSTVRDNLSGLIKAFRTITNDASFPRNRISGISLNVTHSRVGSSPGANAVLPAWRDALYTLNVGIGVSPDDPATELQAIQDKANEWQALFNPLTPGGGGYLNEATYDNPTWKVDYFGKNYDKLLTIKKRYDPDFTFWQHTSVGTDAYWFVAGDGRLCRIS
ncbi:putative FAD-binding domain-containing protein [Seiridium unicorne]|uniref:FAD-binding domain-containing protein n=1 Tax=Seiridium unicorne TaxID=138068 RepID=A0ABR2V0H6_9PEZI